MKNQKIIILFLSLIILSSFSSGLKVTQPITDLANILSQEEEQNLLYKLNELEKNTSVEIAIITIESVDDDPILFATQIGEESGIGKDGKDNGLIILWITSSEKGVIVTGRGIESIITDAKASQFGRESQQLFFDKKYYEGFDYLLNKISNELKSSNTNADSNLKLDKLIYFFIFISISLFILVIIIKYLTSSNDNNYSESYNSSDKSSIIPVPINVGSGKGSGSFSFGGGSFGGGGAGFGK